MIANLYVDHMMSTPPASSEDVWNATREHSRLFTTAASRIGLTPAEYREFRSRLLDGKATYVTLPRRLDAMAGNHRGSVYVVRNAYLTSSVHGWRVALADGNVVYVPQACGNLSLLRPVAVAAVPVYRPPSHVHVVPYAPVVLATETVPAVTPVVVAPPPADAAAAVAAAPAAPAAASSRALSPLLFLIPAALGGIVAGVSHGSPHAVPPCSNGSNSSGACTSSR